MPRITRIVPAVVIASLVVLSVGTPASAASTPAGCPAVSAAHRSSDVAANKAMVTYFYDQLFNQHNLAVIDACIGPVYIQHNARFADGAEALRQFIESQPPGASHNTIVRVIGQGDLVLIHHHAVPTAGGPGTAFMDVFRVSEGKIVEHWDVIQPVPATTASGNDMFGTVSTSAGDRSTRRSERIVLDYYTGLTAKHDLRAVDRFVSPSLVQHDPTLPNGSAAVKAAFAARLQANPELTFSKLQVIADHELVSLRYHVQNSPTDLGQAVDDVYRVAGGRIVEHWSVVQNVPATSANNNTMF
ncbi:MAG TPA: nuclear transport factor 2 family protein [Pseudonocardiaceae bacterium]